MRRTRLSGLSRKLRAEGARGVAQRLAKRAYNSWHAGDLDFPVLPGDLADSASLSLVPQSVSDDSTLRIGWLTTPPSAGSGGHTTMFRMVRALEEAGHECTILLYDRHHGDVQEQARVIREAWPWVRAKAFDIDDGLRQLDACVATSWPTAHVLASRRPDAMLFYFIQDYEPFFYPRGSEYELAADTYRFGFTNIALGHMVQNRLRGELGVASALVPFSCDTSVYSLSNSGPRSGIVCYTKPDVPRRGYRLAALALAEFHTRHPEQEIHVYGDEARDLGVPVTRHHRLTPGELNELYNRCIAGLAMSFTNITLVAEEMLASGCIPVVTDSEDSRAGLDNPHVAWSAPTPAALADSLARTVSGANSAKAVAAASSVRDDNWTAAGSSVVHIIESVTRGTLTAG